MFQPLQGWTVITLAPNVPGPLAAASLRDAGATVIKVEGPAGDPLAQMSPAWYAELHRDIEVRVIDLKAEAGKAEFDALLAGADLLLTSSRPAALARLGLAPERLGRDFPRLCRVTIVGDTREPDAPGHDLTYQAEAGLIDPARPAMPRTLVADLTGSREAYAAALGLLLSRERGQTHPVGRLRQLPPVPDCRRLGGRRAARTWVCCPLGRSAGRGRRRHAADEYDRPLVIRGGAARPAARRAAAGRLSMAGLPVTDGL